MSFETPILFLVFNRLDTTQQVFQRIREIQPARFYIACDGARENKPGEIQTVDEVRQYILSNIDWTCEVKTLFREHNLGCKVAVSSAIDWFFENEEQGIILEDDCLPDESFFCFCEEMLIRYKDNHNIWHIGGTNPIDKQSSSNEYYFSKYNRIWGWATWKRAWCHYDRQISFWPRLKKEGTLKKYFSDKEFEYYSKVFDRVYKGKIDTWDYQWFLIRMINGLAIIPKVNLISNIGFSELATHTNDKNNPLSNLKLGKFYFPYKEPDSFETDKLRDESWGDFIVSNAPEKNIFCRIWKKING